MMTLTASHRSHTTRVVGQTSPHRGQRLLVPLIAGALVCVMPQPTDAQPTTAPEYGWINFEGFSELTAIQNQYAHLGVRFSITGNPSLFPVIATVGAPAVAFTDCNGVDEPSFFDGVSGLADPVIADDIGAGSDIRIDFDPPVQQVWYYARSIGGGCRPEGLHTGVIYQDGSTRPYGNYPINYGTLVQAATANAQGSPVRTLLIQPRTTGIGSSSAPVDLGIDTILFSRKSQSPTSGLAIRVAQESAPGAADFDTNVLGTILPWRAPVSNRLSASQIYRYNTDVVPGAQFPGRVRSFGLGPILLTADRSHLFFAETTDGLAMMIVHGTAPAAWAGYAFSNTTPGHAEMQVSAVSGTQSLALAVQDDPTDAFASVPDAGIQSSWNWPANETDGTAILGWTGDWTGLVSFAEIDGNLSTPPVSGLSSWVAYSATGGLVPLSLAPGRRVQFRAAPPCCAVDLNCSGGQPTVQDLFEFINAYFSQALVADFNHSGQITVQDIFDFLAAYFAGCP